VVKATQTVIREATEEDLPTILDLYEQLSAGSSRGGQPKSPLNDRHRSTLARLQSNPDFHLLVAEHGNCMVGTAALYLLPDIDTGGTVWGVIEHVVVEQAERGKGYGEALMREAMRIAQNAGCYKLSLSSGRQRADSHRFYERLGFRSNSKGFSLYFDGFNGIKPSSASSIP
jgi:GNAT superfamily N-acetyltransferase